MRADIRRLFIWMTLFFVAMAYLESAVVVYLRALYYPKGFDFPLVPMDVALVNTEVFREFATLVMLLAPAALVTRSALERFAWFCFGFGIWDIFYYIWLKVLLDWPSSLASRDLLFLIPVPWVGPVWAPCVVSLGLILLAVIILCGRSKDAAGSVALPTWGLWITGALLIVVSFTLDPILALVGGNGSVDVMSIADARANAVTNGRVYVPEVFPLIWFVVGTTIAFLGIMRHFFRISRA
ncbi:MAG: hypothetical protein KBA60_09170 [Flavobacteriales bacterium]|nr:hypothetical protein [Flavobacteriales bacterium]